MSSGGNSHLLNFSKSDKVDGCVLDPCCFSGKQRICMGAMKLYRHPLFLCLVYYLLDGYARVLIWELNTSHWPYCYSWSVRVVLFLICVFHSYYRASSWISCEHTLPDSSISNEKYSEREFYCLLHLSLSSLTIMLSNLPWNNADFIILLPTWAHNMIFPTESCQSIFINCYFWRFSSRHEWNSLTQCWIDITCHLQCVKSVVEIDGWWRDG